jgi:AraC family transcriptional regulator
MQRTVTEKIHIYVWPERILYLGPGTNTSLHRNHACVWLIAHEGTLKVTLEDGTVLQNEVVYVPSETAYSTEIDSGSIAALYWEPESVSFQRIAQHFESGARGFRCEYVSRGELGKLLNADTSRDEADALIREVFQLGKADAAQSAFVDDRITTALEFLRASPHEYDSIEALSERVHLSPSRFAHLFKEVVGVPVRRYVLWMKLRRALELAIAGDSLTTAALTAGFADGAHLSRSVRSLMGFAPEFLFRHRERLVVHH